MAKSPVAIEVTKLRKSYGSLRVLEGVTFQVKKREYSSHPRPKRRRKNNNGKSA